MTWRNPWMLSLLVLLLLIWWRWLERARCSAVQFSSIAWLKRQEPSVRAKARCILPILRTLAVGLLVLSLTRPQRPHKETRIFSEGVAIQMLVDRSSSMRAMDFVIAGSRADRLAAVKNVFREFVLGGEDFAGRPDDLIGMITFAGYADSRCPLTLDHSFLIEALDQTEIVSPEEFPEEDGTAIGDAIALAVERLQDLDPGQASVSPHKIVSRVIILLTDGENTAGDVLPPRAAELAATCGIKIYAIGIGTTGVAPIPVRDASGRLSLQPMRVSIDEASLRKIAEITGGAYWRATDVSSMREICLQIDELEKTRIEERRYFEYAEAATDAVRIGGLPVPPLLAVVVALLTLEVVLVNTGLRRVP